MLIGYIYLCMGMAMGQSYAQTTTADNESALELIVSGITSFSPSEDKTMVGSEVHLTYWVTPKWGGGLSYSGKFEDSAVLSDMALLGSWNPTRWLTVNTGPNFAFPHGEVREKFRLELYMETEFNWRVSEKFHWGVFTGTVVSGEVEIAAGIHLGFEFPFQGTE